MSKSADATDLEEELIRKGGGEGAVIVSLFKLLLFPFTLIFKLAKFLMKKSK